MSQGQFSAASLDIEKPSHLEAYLKASGRIPPCDSVEMRPLAGGVSNRTVVVEFQNGSQWVIKQALPKLRVAVEWLANPSRVHREALAMDWLNQTLPSGSVPRLIFEDAEFHLLAMECIPEPHENWKSRLLSGDIDIELVRQFGEMLGMMHRRGFVERGSLPSELFDKSHFESLRLEPYYEYTAEQAPEAADFLHALAEDTRARADTFVHGDYSPKNALVYQQRLVLLDHEVAHIGDPAFDVGFALTHLLSKGHHRVTHRERFTVAANHFWGAYQHLLGALAKSANLQERVVRHTLGCLFARVDGRSPLEYFQPAERLRQRSAVIAMLPRPPQTVEQLTSEFLTRV